jgi:DNA-directed RNA polymerase I and III subunit RPAC2
MSDSEAVELCAYSIPHPSENKIHIRVQTDGSVSAMDALLKGFDDLAAISDFMANKFEQELIKGKFEVSETVDW